MADVHETTIQGLHIAHKKVYFRRRISDEDKKEVEILKRLSHVHMVQLIGTYTQQKVLGILMYPIAVCDLHTFFDDVESWTATGSEKTTIANRLSSLKSSHTERLNALGYDFLTKTPRSSASLVYSMVGCLISAVAYLHDQKIRLKDLKPSNILLSRDRLWLSDFGSATDFTLLSQSATDNERGTTRYYSPEMAEWKPNGRASDMFSLGCVLLEIMVLHQTGSLEHIRKHRSINSSFHANLDRIDTWLQWPRMELSPKDYLLRWEIRSMLSQDPANRPTAQQLLTSIACGDISRGDVSQPSLFSDCCRGAYVSQQQHTQQTADLRKKGRSLLDSLRTILTKEEQWREDHMKLHRLLGEKKEQIQVDAVRLVISIEVHVILTSCRRAVSF